MQSELQAENQALKEQLQALLQEARRNEDKMRRFERLEHQLIAAESLQALLSLLLQAYAQAFAIDRVSLILVDKEREISRLLLANAGSNAHLSATLPGLQLLPSALQLQALYGPHSKPLLGRFDPDTHAALLGGEAASAGLGSVALLPLARHGQLIGGLHFGSLDPQRYDPTTGTQLLERLSLIVAVCLESAINQERLKLTGLTDVLTGVHNRRYFEHRCLVEIAQARRYRHPLACLFFDLDHFKSINDQHGHPVGDEVLRGVGHLVQGQLRAGDTIARYGGEEFVLLLPQTAEPFAREIAERIRASLAQQRFVAAGSASGQSQVLSVTASIGLAMLNNDNAGVDAAVLASELISDADQALYRAKQGGRNRVELASRPS
nr:sensor domain-containing diguanylate cyclase [uncultured Roseateles sp.]